MKKIMICMAVMILAVFAVNAQESYQQPQHHYRPSRHHRHGMMAKDLHLSDQQKQQLKDINKDYHKKLMELKKNEDITVREFKSKTSDLRKEHGAQVKALFTPEQKNQIARMKQERMHTAKPNGSARAEKIKIKLGLTDTQASQLKAIHTEMRAKIKSIHTDNSLSHEQKHEQMKNLVLQHKDQLKDILTPEQMQQLEQTKTGRHRKDFAR